MSLRIATLADIEAMHRVRMSVRENRLGDPSRATPELYREMLEMRGRGWVYEMPDADRPAPRIVAFAIADHMARSIWALFVEPGNEGRGIGRRLHATMVEWLFEQSDEPLWLTTDRGTRAERFYLAAGWRPERGLNTENTFGEEVRLVLARPVK